MKKRKTRNYVFLYVALIITLTLMTILFNKAKVNAATLCWPVPGHTELSQGYHDGKAIDISDGNIAGARVVAALGGTVKYVFKCGTQHSGSNGDCYGFGTGVVILGSDNRWYQYAHMQAGSIPENIYVGASVEIGQHIGAVGTTGNSSGNHLHFGISIGNYWSESGINPQNENYQPVGNNPIGCIDLCQSDEIGKLYIRGWSYDADSPSTPIDIHVYIGPNENDQEGYNLGPANGQRKDVDNIYHCGEYHGIDKTISTSRTGNQRVRIFAINVGGGNNALIYDQIVNIKSDSEPPVLQGYDITNLNEKGYTITCTWTDNIGVTRVEFPTWNAETQVGDDAIWYQGTSTEAGKTYSTWKFTFSDAEAGRQYLTHIYGWDAAGNHTCYPLTDTIKAKDDTTAPIFENVDLKQEKEGEVTLSLQLSDDIGLGKMREHHGVYYSMDENSSSCLNFGNNKLIEQSSDYIDCWESSGNSKAILEKEYKAEQTYTVQCDSIVSYWINARDLSGNYAAEKEHTVKCEAIGQEKNRSTEIVLEKGEEITLGAIREKLSQSYNLDCYSVYYDKENQRILAKTKIDMSTLNDLEEDNVVLKGNNPGIEYVYFLSNSSMDLCSCKIQVKGKNLGDVYQDGKIDGKDVSLLLQYRLKKRELDEEQIAAGDVYADGKIDGKDVSKLLQYRLGKIESLE